MLKDMFFDATPGIFEKAKILRSNLTQTETILWNRLRKKQLGVKFRRQHPIGFFIVDFYCHEKKLVIEIDGEYHLRSSQIINDEDRDLELQNLGLNVIRFTDHQVLNEIDRVLDEISNYIGSRTPNP